MLANAYSGASPSVNTLNTFHGATGAAILGGFLGAFAIFYMFVIAVFIITIISMWKIFEKAGKPGWAAIIPIYNIIIMLEITKKPVWWIILLFIPFLNIIFGIVIAYNLAKVFGKGAGFTIGLILLPFIFYPILAFGESKYSVPTAPTPAVA